MSTEAKVDFGGIVLRNTNAGTGRQLAVTPENSAMKHLALCASDSEFSDASSIVH